MALTTLTKQTFEERIFDLDFAAKMVSGESLSSVDSLVSELASGSGSLTISGTTINGTILQAKYAGGVHGSKYKVTGKVTTSLGQKLELEGFITVKDI